MKKQKSYGFMEPNDKFFDFSESKKDNFLKIDKYKNRYVEASSQTLSQDDALICDEIIENEIIDLNNNTISIKNVTYKILDDARSYIQDKTCIKSDYDMAAWMIALCSDSPTAMALIRNSINNDWNLSFADDLNYPYLVDVDNKTIILDLNGLDISYFVNSAYFRNNILTSFIRALRDVWHENKMSSLDKFYNPENLLKLERYRNADIDSAAIMIFWELRGAGHSDIWRFILGSEFGDMAMIFSTYLERDPVSLFNGNAIARTFKHWFTSDERVDNCDNNSLAMIDDTLFDSEQKNPFGNERLKAEYIETLLALPDGTKYLINLGKEIITSPYYAGMNDGVNQTHLLHIIYDLEVTIVSGVPFQDAELAKRIFPVS